MHVSTCSVRDLRFRATPIVLMVAAVGAAAGCRRDYYTGSGEPPPTSRAPDISREAFAREAFVLTRRKARVQGWVDSQPLAVPDSGPSVGTTAGVARGAQAPRLRYGPGAKIVPIDYLEHLVGKDFAQWRTVAYIYSEGAYPKLGIPHPDSVGRPVALELRHISDRDSVGWEARVVYPPARYVSRTMPVHRHKHSPDEYPVPGSARWIFTADDEAGWIDCDMGCCTVGGGHVLQGQ